MKKLLLILLLIVFFIPLVRAQPIRDIKKTSSDTISAVSKLLYPSFSTFDFSKSKDKNEQEPKSDNIEISKASKFLLQLGANAIRESATDGDIPLYNLQNGWKYPGPTIQYPESVSEYEQFLERYDHFKH